MKLNNTNKVRIINGDRIISFYDSIGFEFAYKKRRNGKYPVIIDKQNNIAYHDIACVSNDSLFLIYDSALFVNNLMFEQGRINEKTKDVLDKQMYKYLNGFICLN